jgi:hypothetical protein
MEVRKEVTGTTTARGNISTINSEKHYWRSKKKKPQNTNYKGTRD